jgi:hypothetical protein
MLFLPSLLTAAPRVGSTPICSSNPEQARDSWLQAEAAARAADTTRSGVRLGGGLPLWAVTTTHERGQRTGAFLSVVVRTYAWAVPAVIAAAASNSAIGRFIWP